jgi:DNA repair photolyase
LAQELWASAVHEARILASMIDDPKAATEEQMERWVRDFGSWDTCDQCCMNLIEGHSNVESGMTLTTLERGVAAPFEPKTSAPNDGIRILSKANDTGIRTFIFPGPLLPFVSDRGKGLEELPDVIAGINRDYFLVNRLNPRYGIWPAVSATLSRYDPGPIPKYQGILHDKHTRDRYTSKLGRRIREEAKQRGLAGKMQLRF